jgi:branched-chain amino acid transport system substrate-binding protein
MKIMIGKIATAIALTMVATMPASAQNGQFVPVLSFRTGPYGGTGAPWANGVIDYYNLVNVRDGGINGVKLLIEECETGFATDKGVECYERLKGKGPTGAAFVNPISTGITYALTEKAPTDKIPIITMGYGRGDSKNGAVFTWNFPLLGTYWTAADIMIQHIAKELGGEANLTGKKISLIYHDSPFGKEPIPALEALSQRYGFTFTPIPVTHPGVEQKSQWLTIRQTRPDYVLLWGWGVMTGTAIKEAAAVGYPRQKMLGVWWSGAEQDVAPAGDDSKGYKALALQHGAGKAGVHHDIEKYVYAKDMGLAKPEDVGQVLYNRGVVNAMLGVEAIRKAQERFGQKPLTGEQVRWGLENLKLSQSRLKELGFDGVLRPIDVSCSDHEGAREARVQQWDGKNWTMISDWYSANQEITEPLVKANSEKYAADKKASPRDCSKVSPD